MQISHFFHTGHFFHNIVGSFLLNFYDLWEFQLKMIFLIRRRCWLAAGGLGVANFAVFFFIFFIFLLNFSRGLNFSYVLANGIWRLINIGEKGQKGILPRIVVDIYFLTTTGIPSVFLKNKKTQTKNQRSFSVGNRGISVRELKNKKCKK